MTSSNVRKPNAKMPDSDLVSYVNGIIMAMTDNAGFPGVGTLLEEVKNDFQIYEISIPIPSERNSRNAAIKNENKATLINSLTRLSKYVDYTAHQNMDALKSSGFELTNIPQPKGKVGHAEELTLRTNGVEGLVIVQCKRDPNATTYRARVSKDGENWTWYSADASPRILVTGLPQGELLYVQVRAENPLGVGPWSSPVLGSIGVSHVIKSIHD